MRIGIRRVKEGLLLAVIIILRTSFGPITNKQLTITAIVSQLNKFLNFMGFFFFLGGEVILYRVQSFLSTPDEPEF